MELEGDVGWGDGVSALEGGGDEDARSGRGGFES